MANEGTIDVAAKYVSLTVPIPKNTTVQTTTFDLGERIFESLSVLFAPGHAGLTGFRISYGGVTILPWNQPGGMIVGDNERRYFDMGLHVSGLLTIQTKNFDKAYAHSIVFEAKLTEILLAGGPPVPTVVPFVGVA